MSSSEHSPFMALPYEVLVKIFSYLDIEDLLKSTQFVCTKWKDLSHDLRVWKHREFVTSQTKERLIKSLRAMPSLQHLVLNNLVPDSILICIPGQCRQLRVFEYHDEELSCDFLAKLCSHCPRLERLSVYIETECVLEEIGKFPNLKHLAVRTANLPVLVWKPIADGCPSLISLGLLTASIKPAEFAYLLEKKKHQLTALSCKSCVEECLLPYITGCEKLKKLFLLFDLYSTTRHKACLLLLRSVKTITNLTLFVGSADQSEVLELFKNRGMCQLEEIPSSVYSNELFCTILQNCPLLKKVLIGPVDPLVESSMHHLEALPFLESLNLSHCKMTGNVWQYLQNCVRLSHLDLSSCFDEPCLGSKHTLPELKNLKCLILADCNLIEFPFNEVLSKFPKLEFLDLAHSALSDVETVHSLSRQKRQLKVNLVNCSRDEANQWCLPSNCKCMQSK